MATLRDIRQRINGVKNTAKITQAMKMVAAAKMNRAQNAIESARPYVDKMSEVIAHLTSGLTGEYFNPLLSVHEKTKNIKVIVISSDKGLCGAFNNNLFKYANKIIDNEIKDQFPEAKHELIPVGKKAFDYYKKRDLNLDKHYTDVFSNLQFEIVPEILEEIKINFKNENVDRVFIFYNEFVSVATQNPKYIQLLPIEPDALTSSDKEDDGSADETDYIFEPGKAQILDELIPNHVNIRLWRSLLESNAAEQAARMMAMDNATNNANDLINELNLSYNKQRQAEITSEMLEIVSGANALQD